MCNSPTSIVVHESVPAKTLLEFIAYAKANPTKLSYGTAGTGTLTHLAGELFKQLIGVPGITHVPYKGAAPAGNDLAGGHVDTMFCDLGTILSLHRADRVRIIAAVTQKRIGLLPETPTVDDSALPGFVSAMRRASAATRPA